MKKVLPVFFFLLVMSTVVPASFTDIGSTVTMNLAFNIGGDKSDDSIESQDNFVSIEDNNVILALVTKNNEFGTNSDSGYSATENLIQMKQRTKNNRFLLTFTQGTNQTIQDKIQTITHEKIIKTRFGDLTFTKPLSFSVFLRLEFDNLDIISKKFWKGDQKIIIKNEGLIGIIPKISIVVV